MDEGRGAESDKAVLSGSSVGVEASCKYTKSRHTGIDGGKMRDDGKSKMSSKPIGKMIENENFIWADHAQLEENLSQSKISLPESCKRLVELGIQKEGNSLIYVLELNLKEKWKALQIDVCREFG